LGSAGGGFFPTSWGWATLAFLWIAAVTVLVGSQPGLTMLETGFLGGLLVIAIWVGASSGWSTNVTQTVLEVERTLVYVSGVLALLLLARGRSPVHVLAGVLTGIVFVSSYALATRLFPERAGTFPIPGNRLSEPLTYANGLGIFAAMGALLALGFVARGRSRIARATGAASLLVLVPVIYFTFSRGAWIALGLGLLGAIALDQRRLQLTTALLVATPAPVAAVVLASRSEAFTQQDAGLMEAARQGRELALFIVLLAFAAAFAAVVLREAERRLAFGRPVRLAYGAALVVVVAVGLVLVFARYGGPSALASKAYDAFRDHPAPVTGDLNERLFSFEDNWRAEIWGVAWSNYEAHPWLGSGAGTYEQVWMRDRPVAVKVRDAHSLYLEILSELGPVGLILLVSTLAFPVLAGIKARQCGLGSAALGAYTAYLAHAGVDWDWEMPVVTVTALFSGVALLVAAERRESKLFQGRRIGGLALILVLASFAFVGLVSNRALTRSAEAGLRGDIAAAQTQARRAARWAPWSYQPWQQLGELELADGSRARAHTHFLKAIAKNQGDWELWLDLVLASDGRGQLQALKVASRLNPRSPQIAEIAKSLDVP